MLKLLVKKHLIIHCGQPQAVNEVGRQKPTNRAFYALDQPAQAHSSAPALPVKSPAAVVVSARQAQ
jgi:hypothetical protein